MPLSTSKPDKPSFRLTARLTTRLLAAAVVASLVAAPLKAQTPPAAPTPAAPERTTPNALGPTSLEGLPILGVEVIGAVRTDPHLILDQIRAQPGQPYSRAQIDVDTRTVAALDRFVTVTPYVIPKEDPATHTIKGVVIQFKVEERSLVSAVEIRGNRQFKESELRDLLVIHLGGSADPFAMQTDIKSMLAMYRKKGYAQTSITINKDALKQGIVRYEIIEGPRAKISKIIFDGNDNVKGSYLKWKIQTQTYFWIFRKGVLDEDKLQQDLVTIRDIYRKRGYLDARVSYLLDYNEDKTKLVLRFSIIEGPRFKIGKINFDFVGDPIFSRSELLGDTSRLGPGSYAEGEKIELMLKRIEDRYGHEGYIYRDVKIDVAYTDNPAVVDINFSVTAGKPYLVGRVIVRGNPNIQDRVIRRQVRIYPDQTYDAVLVRKSIERLKGVRIFQDVKITPIGNDPATRDALVEIAEGQSGKFSVGAGVSSNSGIAGNISVQQQNFDITNPPRSLDELFSGQSFKGAGQYFQILLQPGTEFQQYSVTFSEPFVFDSPYSFSNDLHFFTRSRESWNERRIGDIVTVGRRFGDIWSVSLSLRAEQVTISGAQDANANGITDSNYFLTDPTTSLPIGPFNDTTQEILDNQKSTLLTSIKPGVFRDSTDSNIFPTTGSRTSASWEQYGAAGGNVHFSKFVVRYDTYFPLHEDLFERKTVLALRNEVGVSILGNSPFFERFYAGGIGSLRGFKFRGAGPHSGPLDDPVGGDFEWVSTAEVNYPIWEKFLRGVVFLDVGTVEKDITVSNIRSDFGIGARITIPMFGQLPLAVDFAFPVTKAPGDKTQLISFALGIPL